MKTKRTCRVTLSLTLILFLFLGMFLVINVNAYPGGLGGFDPSFFNPEKLSSANVKDGKASCQSVKCEEPRNKDECKLVSKKDQKVPQPEGSKAKCCPVWKCMEKDGKTYTTFHGIAGEGIEKVRYSNTAGADKVMSVATGKHDAKAIAGDGAKDSKFLADAAKTFQSFGLTF